MSPSPPDAPAPAAPVWNLLEQLEGASGAWQMALDEALLEEAAANPDFRPTLRLYVFSPGCLSLGRTQKLASVDAEGARAEGLHLVRRVTGGSGVLHHGELTYSVVARTAPPFADDIEQNYTLLSRALAAGLARHFGVSAELEPSRPAAGPGAAHGACFLTPALKELKVGGRKLVGSAQRRVRGALLQHGALPLRTDYALHGRLFGLAPERLRGAMVDLEEAAGRAVSHAEAARALRTGFEEQLGVRWSEGGLGAGSEARVRARAEQLVAGRYGLEAWTREGQDAMSNPAALDRPLSDGGFAAKAPRVE
ncbi:lipoate--protein ligase family protein [Aggregicoccus sp. 17bor-14]|uniref:lipoate--protein ligase family protein n=1 Tax=Myxococcaceae TaxID=31 RepID=UPI00129CFDA2|nr:MULTISPECIES: lipoate--protein ligase family protein [Myxococcaceae]MBF5046166.1 lipoate--protein ligase family protein [Simulacricoccus sp. 17bor-14]MRI91891.1 lipoate--protein ligase family protein [Aggregicoccus sp. 17bor-14]